VTNDRDLAMDAYAFTIEALRVDDCRRLRAYAPDGKTPFRTWLIVVTRRLVLDHLRQRYGRSRSGDATRQEEHKTRRRLENLLAAEIEPDQLEGGHPAADAAIRRDELTRALQSAVARLHPDERLLITLRFLDERSVSDIARILSFPSVFHVYRRIDAVLRTLRKALIRDGVDGAEP